MKRIQAGKCLSEVGGDKAKNIIWEFGSTETSSIRNGSLAGYIRVQNFIVYNQFDCWMFKIYVFSAEIFAIEWFEREKN